MPNDLILAIDQGTTGTKAAVYDTSLACLARAYRRVKWCYPNPGWVESDPEALLESVIEAGRKALSSARLAGHAPRFFGLANQGETVVAWDRRTGRAISPGISWQCRRGIEYCDEAARKVSAREVHSLTGLRLDPYFSAPKLRWIIENIPEARSLARRKRLAIGTTDAWILWRLTGGKAFITDPSTACRTLLFNIRTLDWDPRLLDAFNIERAWLPELRDTSGPGLATISAHVWGMPLIVTAMACDQPSAAFGQRMFTPGACKCTYGTGAFVQTLSGSRPHLNQPPLLLSSIAWKIGPQVDYLLDGAIYTAGAVLDWCVRLTQQKEEVPILLQRAFRKIPHDLAPLCIPSLTGMGAPYWLPNAPAEFRNLKSDAKANDLLRAAAQGIALRVYDVIETLRSRYSINPTSIMADGGVARSRAFLRYQANILEMPVDAGDDADMTARGCAMLAGLGAGLWNQSDLCQLTFPSYRMKPDAQCSCAENHRTQWRNASNDFVIRETAESGNQFKRRKR